MHSIPSLSLRLARAAAFVVATLTTTALHATLPAIEAVVDFTGNRADGTGNGALPGTGSAAYNPGKMLVRSSDGYLYSGTLGGGGTSDVHILGGSGAVFYRYGSSGLEVLERNGTAHYRLATGTGATVYSGSGGLSHYSGGAWSVLVASNTFNSNSWTQGPDGRFYNGAGTTSLSVADPADTGAGITTLYTSVGAAELPAALLWVHLAHSNGYLYGVARVSGTTSLYLYRIRPDGTGFQTLTDMSTTFATAGTQPFVPSLLEAPDGSLYGTGYRGGDNGTGVLFHVAADGSGFTVLHSFGATASNIDGYYPRALESGSDGHVYGIATAGGLSSGGTLFRWNTTDSRFDVLYAFGANTGTALSGSVTRNTNAGGRLPLDLTRGADGNLYGLANEGGANGWGTVFRFTPGDEIPLYSYTPAVSLSATTTSNTGTAIVATSIGLGRSLSFAWKSHEVDSCTASSNEPSGGWQGARAIESSGQSYAPTAVGTWTYTLTCTSTNATYPADVTGSYTVQVLPASAGSGSAGSGGGAATGALLALLPLAGLVQRRRRAARAGA